MKNKNNIEKIKIDYILEIAYCIGEQDEQKNVKELIKNYANIKTLFSKNRRKEFNLNFDKWSNELLEKSIKICKKENLI